MTRILLALFFTGLIHLAHAQSSNIPLNGDYNHLINRYEIKNGELATNYHSSFQSYQRKNIAVFTDSILIDSKADEFNQQYLKNDNWEWAKDNSNTSAIPVLRHFYKTKSDLYHVRTKDFDLHVNPVLYLSGGIETESDDKTYVNTRGVEVRGMVDNKVGFYSFIGENQAVFPTFVRNAIASQDVVPGEGFWKKFKDNGVDFFTARGYISFDATKHINLQFGHDRFFIGNGYRSLILSDYAPSMTFLKMNTKVWKFSYTNLYGQLTADAFGNAGGLFGSGGFPNKYIALHHLSLNIGSKFNVGIFESVTFGRQDDNNFQVKYLNPIIFYRALEQQNGSSDNVLLGLDFKWLVMPKVAMYGQLILDEFLLENLKEGKGWWGNKYGLQLGAKYVDAFGIDNLDLQGETNIVRPYTYSHQSIYTNYAHYLQPLAHPKGANFKEIIGIVKYQPIPKLTLTGKAIINTYGTDTTGVNWGGNVLLDNGTREQNLNNEIGQGISTTLTHMELMATYQLRHNLFIDLRQLIRNENGEINTLDQKTSYTSLSVRLNISKRVHDF